MEKATEITFNWRIHLVHQALLQKLFYIFLPQKDDANSFTKEQVG